MGVRTIEKFSKKYAVLKFVLRFWHHRIFYRKVVYVGREKLPLNEHLIFTPNHQNALMDALAVEFSFNNQFVFLARSDIFKNKHIARILYFLKILPVYRIRDGYESLKKNEMIFKKTLDIIRNKNGFVILPEGNHAGFRKLRVLKKGFARIAFQAEEAENFLLDMKIVPVGINYSDYESFRSELLVIFGKPFPVSEFYEIYKENPAVAYNQIREKLASEMKPLMINIESAYYEVYDFLRKDFNKNIGDRMQLDVRNLYDRFRAEKKIISILEKCEKTEPETMQHLAEKTTAYLRLLQKMKLPDVRPVSVAKILVKTIVLIVAFPLFVYGYINHFFPWNICIITGKKIKDPQFRSSFKFVLSFLTFPLFYLLQTAVVQVWFHRPLFTLIYFLSLPVSAAVSWNYARLFRTVMSGWRYWMLKNKKDDMPGKAQQLYAAIHSEAENIFQKYF